MSTTAGDDQLDEVHTDGPDLIVAGAGGGLVGAILAAQQGASVLVVEANPYFLSANNTAMSTAMIPGAGSRFQQAAGVPDSPDRFVADIMRKTGGSADPVLARAIADISAPLVEWLMDNGLPISLVEEFDYPGHSVPRCHTVPGRSGTRLLSLLYDLAKATPGLDILLPARVVAAQPGPTGGWVATVRTPDGAEEQIGCANLLLATSGFGADPELVARHAPEIAGATYHGSEQARGDALRIGSAVGADTGYLDAYQGHGALTAGAATLAGWALVMHGGIVVNEHGDRFADETMGYSEFAALELTQPGQSAVIVYDTRIRELCGAFDDYQATEASGVVRTGDAERIADNFGLDRDQLMATLTEAERVRCGDAVDTFGRTRWGPAPLSAPYHAVRVVPALFHTQGGLRVDHHARVLNPDGATIPGLYAAGGAAMGVSGHGASGYLAGNGLITALGLAFLTARDVSARQIIPKVLS